MKCTGCGSENWMMVGQVGALETWRCNACGKEELRHVNFAAPLVMPPSSEPVLEISVRWTGAPLATQVTELQKTFPRLRKLSAVDLLKVAKRDGVLNVGRYTDTELAPLRPKLEALGVEVEVKVASTR